MAFDKLLASRIRAALRIFPKSISEQLSEKAMFGGLAFLYKGKMTVGIVKNDLMVRVVGSNMETVLKRPYVRAMDFCRDGRLLCRPEPHSAYGQAGTFRFAIDGGGFQKGDEHNFLLA